MKVIDAYTGCEVKVGDWVPSPDGTSWRLVSVCPGVFSASCQVELQGQVRDVPLIVRWLHPNFFLQHVAFFPS